MGLSLLKSGWMCASLTTGLGGREVSGTIFGGGGSAGGSGSSDGSGKGPSNARAGETGRLPGMGSKTLPREGAVPITASLATGSTLLVSHVSNPSGRDTSSMD